MLFSDISCESINHKNTFKEDQMNTKSLFAVFVIILSSTSALFTANIAIAEENENLGIYLRHIVYFPNLATAKKASKNTSADKQFERVKSFPKNAKSSVYNQLLIEDVSKDFPMANINYLSYFGRGMSDQEREQVQAYSSAVLFDFMFPASSRDNSLIDISQIILDIASENDGYIWDSETRELFSPSEWKIYRINSWKGNVPNVKLHTVIHAYQEGEGFRAITLGMAKFGLPDLVISDFEWNDSRSISSLINLTTQHIVEQGLDKTKLQLDIEKLKDSSFKESLVDTLYENASKSMPITLVESNAHEGDPDNYLLEFDFNQYEGKSNYSKQSSLLGQLFGWKDEVTYVKHNIMIETASLAARKKLPELKTRFNKGLEIGESISLKAPFETPSGSWEWMWVQVLSWNDGVIKGLLRNVPRDVPSLKEGDEVTIMQKDVFDYIFYNKDGTSVGNTTGEIIKKLQ